MEKKAKIYIAGETGMVGSAILRNLKQEGFSNFVFTTYPEYNLTDQKVVENFFKKEKPEYVFLAAARVGGIKANMNHKAEFLYENLMIQNNVIHQSYLNKVNKLIFLGSSCVYPKECSQPMKEEYLLTGKLESTNEAYAIAKIAGLKLANYYNLQFGLKTLSLMPCNLYGTNDHFDLDNSHVLSALVRRFVDATENREEEITIWGTGIARREFMHVDDFANAVYLILNNFDSPDFINVGTGIDISIKELACLIAAKTKFNGNILWDSKMPDGMLRKLLDVSKLKDLGFLPKIDLEKGIELTINEYKKQKAEGKIL